VHVGVDPNTGTYLAGLQDNGTVDQLLANNPLWSNTPLNANALNGNNYFVSGDGDRVLAEGTATFNGQPVSIRYYLANDHRFLWRAVYAADGTLIDTDSGTSGVFPGASQQVPASRLPLGRPGLTTAAVQV